MKLALGLLLWITCILGHAEAPAVAFYYGDRPPWHLLQSFDLVVVDPDHVPNPLHPRLAHTRLAAYVAVGEVQPGRKYAKRIPSTWLAGTNAAWGSRLIDQTAPGWPAFFVDEIIAPLWAAGYRDFFLDTLDSYQLFARDERSRARQEAALVEVVRLLKARFPAARLIFNRGFEILPQINRAVFAVAAESLFQGYDATKRTYHAVPAADRDWLLGQLKRVRDEYGLPVIAIDYLPPARRNEARATAQRIAELGFIPWVSTPELDYLGIGAIEAMPRRILAIHEPLADEYALRYHSVIRHASMPLHYLGYEVEFADPDHLPPQRLGGQLAGILVWLSQSLDEPRRQKLTQWLARQHAEGLAITLLGDVGFLIDTPLGRSLGFLRGEGKVDSAPVRITKQGPLIGFERAPKPHPRDFTPLTVAESAPELVIEQGSLRQEAAALTSWGGYAMDPFVTAVLPAAGGEQWIIDPFAFFKSALRLPEMPIPDVTTESGRRMLLVHMDGDGFPSRAELPGSPFAGAVVRDRIVKRYHLPMTLSIIEGEISSAGLHARDAPALEQIARDIFAQPHVEIASHSLSHPFVWRKVAAGATATRGGYSLNIPGYQFDARREIEGSINYIQEHLAPPGKKVKLFLWTGDCIPGADVLGIAAASGVPNMNGGDTTATTTQPSMTQVEGLGIKRGNTFQVFAPNQNENVYTNNWAGPFYGYRRVIETFEFTERPRRLKPINIYFHTYLVTKPQGLKSLEEAFDWALRQETTPVFAAEYARKAANFGGIAIARDGNGWRIRGADELRTLRVSTGLGIPSLDGSRGLGGYAAQDNTQYVHLTESQAYLALAARATPRPRLVSANGRIVTARVTPAGGRWDLQAHVPLVFSLAHGAGCKVSADGRPLSAERRSGEIAHYRLPHAAATIETICRP